MKIATSTNPPSPKINAVVWIAPNTDLIIGATNKEWVIRPDTSEDAPAKSAPKAINQQKGVCKMKYIFSFFLLAIIMYCGFAAISLFENAAYHRGISAGAAEICKHPQVKALSINGCAEETE